MGGSTILWTTIEVFPQRGLAEVGGSALRSAGVPFRIIADDGGGMALPLGLVIHGAELQVPADQAKQARALLHLDAPLDPSSPQTTAGLRARTDRRLAGLLALVIALGVLLVGVDMLLR